LHASSDSRFAVGADLRISFLQVATELVVILVESLIVGIGIIWEVLCETGGKQLLVSQTVGAEERFFGRLLRNRGTRSTRVLSILNLIGVLLFIARGICGRRICDFAILISCLVYSL